MCRPLDPPFSPQVHPLVGYTDVKNTPIGYHFFILSHSLWVIFVKFSYLATILGSFCENLILRLGVKFTPQILRLGWKFTPRTPHPYPFWGEVPPPPPPPHPRGFSLVYMTVGHVDLKVCMPCKNFHVPSQYFKKLCKGYEHCWENKYMPRLKNHLPWQAHNHNSLCALRQDLHVPQACGHTLMSSPAESLNLSRSHRALNKLSQNWNE